jgi:sugar phosphate isomerase/epimerase
MNRRQFLQSSTLAAAAASLGAATSACAADDTAFKLHYTLASSLYGDLPLATILGEMKTLGVSEIELWPRKHATQREQVEEMGHDKFKALLEQHGVKMTGTTRYDLGALKLTDELDFVKKFGGSFIVAGGGGKSGPAGDALKAEVKKLAEKLKPHGARGAELGVTIAIENHGNNLIFSPDSLRWLADFAPPGIGIALAPYHLPQETALISELIRHIGPKLTLFYAWEYGMSCSKAMPKNEELMQLPGRGKLDYTPLLKALKDIKFTGPTEIFMHPTPRGIPILPTAQEVTAEINRARGVLDAIAV